jgi:hypothetical protein
VLHFKSFRQIDWTPPSQPNGVLVKYIVSLYPVKSDGSADVSGAKVWSTETAAETSYVIGTLEPDRKYGITVKAVNSHYTGNASQIYPFTYRVKNNQRVAGLEVIGERSEDNAMLRWQKIKDGSDVEYKISTKSDNLVSGFHKYPFRQKKIRTIFILKLWIICK